MKKMLRRILFGTTLFPLLAMGSGYFGTGSGGGASIGGTVTGGTDASVLFVHPSGVLAQDNANFSYSLTNHQLTFGVAPIITPFSSAGLVHNSAAGLLSSSLLINADVSASAAIAYSKLAALTTGSVPYYGTNGLIQDNANFFYDTTNHRLGVGTATPSAPLHAYINNIAGGTPLLVSSSGGVGSPTILQVSDGVTQNIYLKSSGVLLSDTNTLVLQSTAGGVTTKSSSGIINFGTAVTTYGGWDVSGNWRVGNITATVPLDVNGNARFRGITTLGVGHLDTSGNLTSSNVVNADVDSAAAISFSKLASLTSAHLLVGSAGAVATDTAVTGDVTISNAGVTAIGANAVTNAKAAQMNANTIKGNNTGSLANATDLTVSQVNTLLGTLSNPMTTGGDIIYGGSSGTPTRLANGSATQVLTSNGTTLAPSWQAAATGTVTSVTFTGDGTVLSSTPSSAVTTTGTLTAALKTQTAQTFLKGPASGSAAAPTFAALTPLNIVRFTANGTYTPTTSPVPLWIKIRAIGGGGGGSGSGTASSSSNGGNGGDTSFNSTSVLKAGGGLGCGFGGSGGAGGTNTLSGPVSMVNLSGGVGMGVLFSGVNSIDFAGSPGAPSPFSGGGGSSQGSAGGTPPANSGAGGGGGGLGAITSAYNGCGGGAGGYVEAVLTGALSATYTILIGGGGTGGGAGTSGLAGGAGGSGFVIIEEHFQ